MRVWRFGVADGGIVGDAQAWRERGGGEGVECVMAEARGGVVGEGIAGA